MPENKVSVGTLLKFARVSYWGTGGGFTGLLLGGSVGVAVGSTFLPFVGTVLGVAAGAGYAILTDQRQEDLFRPSQPYSSKYGGAHAQEGPIWKKEKRFPSPSNWKKVRGFVLPVLVIALLASAVLYLAAERIEPTIIVVEPFGDSGFNRIVLTERAAERLGIQTALVREQEIEGSQRLVIPSAAVTYGLNGETWVYISPETLTFVRDPITVEYIEGNLAVLAGGPPIGTEVVTVGVALLYSTDIEVSR